MRIVLALLILAGCEEKQATTTTAPTPTPATAATPAPNDLARAVDAALPSVHQAAANSELTIGHAPATKKPPRRPVVPQGAMPHGSVEDGTLQYNPPPPNPPPKTPTKK